MAGVIETLKCDKNNESNNQNQTFANSQLLYFLITVALELTQNSSKTTAQKKPRSFQGHSKIKSGH